jgi:hypothetical protein
MVKSRCLKPSFMSSQRVEDKNSLIVNAAKYLYSLPFVGLLLVQGNPVEAVILLKAEQIGNNVHIIGSGSANLSSLIYQTTDTSFQNVITDTQVFAGASIFAGSQVDLYGNILTGPGTISSHSSLTEEPDPVLSSGDLFGILTDPYTLALPKGYVSTNSLNGTSVYKNKTLALLGLSPGLSTWTWGSPGSATFDSINLEVVPGPFSLSGAVAAYAWGKRLRKKIRKGYKKL